MTKAEARSNGRALGIQRTYSALVNAAIGRQAVRYDGKTRVFVRDGHVSRAVGSSQVLNALRDSVATLNDVEVIVAGSDGASHAEPTVYVEHAGGHAVEFTRVTTEQARTLASQLSDIEAEPSRQAPFRVLQERRVLANCGFIEAGSIDAYLVKGGYAGLAAVLDLTPDEVIKCAVEADVRGRGGAYFPAGRKWQAARAISVVPRYVVVNAEEGEPGTYKDRHMMEGDPHLLIDGLLIAGYAAGASKGYIYINAEADLSAERVERAVSEAVQTGFLGSNILGSTFSFQVEIRRGAGGYVCGEETTLLNTIEGRRRVPRLRPPFPTEKGLFGRPTVINNVETLCNVALLFRPGLDGVGQTKLISLSGAVKNPGLVEVPFGTSMRSLIYDIGGGPLEGRKVIAALAGGPSGGLLPERHFDITINPGAFHKSGAVLGSGGIVVIDESMPILSVVRTLAAYNAAESCGKCTPCREGTPRLVDAVDQLIEGGGTSTRLDELRELGEVIAAASLCGLGQMAAGPINSALEFFRDEMSGDGARR